jgi:hypothetical protein
LCESARAFLLLGFAFSITRLPDYPVTRSSGYPITRLPDHPITRSADYPIS